MNPYDWNEISQALKRLCIHHQVSDKDIDFEIKSREDLKKLAGLEKSDKGDADENYLIIKDNKETKEIGIAIVVFDDARTAVHKAADLATESVAVKGLGHGGIEITDLFLPLPTVVISCEKRESLEKNSFLKSRDALKTLDRYPWVEVVYWFDGELLFSIRSEYQTDLDSRSIPAALQQEFENNRLPLSQNATVLAQRQGSEWRINDSDNGQVYVLRKEGSILNIYDGEYSPIQRLKQALSHAIDQYDRIYSKITAVLVEDEPLKTETKEDAATQGDNSSIGRCLADAPQSRKLDRYPWSYEQVEIVNGKKEEKAICEITQHFSENLGKTGIFMDLNFDRNWEESETKESEHYNGLDLIAKLKPVVESPDRISSAQKYREIGHPPIVALTGYDDKEHIIQAIRTGADDYVMKKSGNKPKECFIRAFHTLFTLFSRQNWLQCYLCDIARILEPNKDRARLDNLEKWLDSCEFKEEIKKMRKAGKIKTVFPTGTVPSFIFELYHAIETLRKELVDAHPEAEDPVGIRDMAQRLREALIRIPEGHRQCEYECKRNGNQTELHKSIDNLSDFFHQIHQNASKQIEKSFRKDMSDL